MFDNFTLDLNRGDKIALIGASGDAAELTASGVAVPLKLSNQSRARQQAAQELLM